MSSYFLRCHVCSLCGFMVLLVCSLLFRSMIHSDFIRKNQHIDASTNPMRQSLFSVQIPVPEQLFFDRQSKQCDTAMGGCSHYLCSITFLWTCQTLKKDSVSTLFFPPWTPGNSSPNYCLFEIRSKLLQRFKTSE